MFGSHLSIAGGMHLALLEAERLGLECVQVFTKNQQQWKAPPLKPEAVEMWRREVKRLGWEKGERAADPGIRPRAASSTALSRDRDRITSHASYLINMGSPDDTLREMSIALMREEIERCETLGIPLLVFHPGAHTTGTREKRRRANCRTRAPGSSRKPPGTPRFCASKTSPVRAAPSAACSRNSPTCGAESSKPPAHPSAWGLHRYLSHACRGI